jgi:hypothetical protein
MGNEWMISEQNGWPSCRAKLGARGLVYRRFSDFGVQQFSELSSVDKYLSRMPRSMVKPNGFRKISAAPASRARFLTPGSWKAVMMITGISRVAGFAFRRAVAFYQSCFLVVLLAVAVTAEAQQPKKVSSSPVISGKHISIRIKSGCF